MALELFPDVVVMDPRMCGADAFIACREIVHDTKGNVHVLFLVDHPRVYYVDRSVKNGGSGVVSLRQTSLEELAFAINHVAKGKEYYSPEFAARFEALTEGKAPVMKMVSLSDREKEVLRQLGLGRTNREIAISMDICLRLVEKAVSDIKKKLNLATTSELLIYGAHENLVPEIGDRDSETAKMLRGERTAAEEPEGDLGVNLGHP